MSAEVTSPNAEQNSLQQQSDSVAFPEHKSFLKKQLRLIRKRGWQALDSQYEIISDAASHMSQWIPHIWKGMVEDGVELSVIRSCLVFCSETINTLGEYVSAEYDLNAYDITITNKQGQIVFTNPEFCNVSDFLLWMWKELMVFSETRDGSASVLEDMEKLRLTEKVFSRLRQSYEKDSDENPDGYEHYDKHWDDAMVAAATRLCIARAHLARVE